MSLWIVSHKYDRDGVRLLRNHYSRRKPESPQFMPPGETLVLVSPARDAVWGWWRPHPDRGIRAMNGLDGWTCSVFHRAAGALASDLVLAAEVELVEAERRGDLAAPCGPDGLLTYVWPSKIKSTNPGYCFQLAGWTRAGYSKKTGKQRKRLLRKPFWLAGIAACEWFPRSPTKAWLDAREATIASVQQIARAA